LFLWTRRSSRFDPLAAEIVLLRVFSGLSIEEVASAE